MADRTSRAGTLNVRSFKTLPALRGAPVARRTVVAMGLNMVSAAAFARAMTDSAEKQHGAANTAGAVPPLPHPVAVTDDDRTLWAAFKERFVLPDGRVIDTANHGVSHTEGQGWGLLFAVTFDDPATFELLLKWTVSALQRDSDHLFSWRYDPGLAVKISDPNNATDGDVTIAAALWRAAGQWNRPDYAAMANAIAADILRLLVVRVDGRLALLPGISGFRTQAGVAINPSYYVFPLLDDLAQAAPSSTWNKLQSDGADLIAQGCATRSALPADWMLVMGSGGQVIPAPGHQPRFSYDAVRVPLYMAWAGVTPDTLRQGFLAWWNAPRPRPAWIDVQTGAVANYAAPGGMEAVGDTTVALLTRSGTSPLNPITHDADYYSAALTVLARVAWRDSATRR